jgi:Tc5 transposase DNA-binding domain
MAKYRKSEQLLDEAIEYKKQHPNASFRWLESQFKVKKDRICRRWNDTQQARSRIHGLLDLEQNKALIQYCYRLSEIGVSLRHKFIRNAANQILQQAYGDRPGSPSTAGQNWPYRWL